MNAIISLNERYASIPTLGGQIPAVVSICQPVQLTGALPMLIAQGQTNVSFVSACANCTISGANAATGGSENWYPIFSIAAGGVTISGLTLQYGGAQGLAGGSSNPQCGTGGGGGGGMGAGGALFVGSAANVTMIDCNFLSNVACGGGGGQAMDEDGYDGAGGFGGSLNGTNYKCGVAGAAGAGAGGAGNAGQRRPAAAPRCPRAG